MKVKTKGHFMKQKASSNNMKMLFIKHVVKSPNSLPPDTVDVTNVCGFKKGLEKLQKKYPWRAIKGITSCSGNLQAANHWKQKKYHTAFLPCLIPYPRHQCCV